MKFTYLLIREISGWTAECIEADAIGEGITRTEAVASLREALEERMFRPDAVAPPSKPDASPIELVPASQQKLDALDRIA